MVHSDKDTESFFGKFKVKGIASLLLAVWAQTAVMTVFWLMVPSLSEGPHKLPPPTMPLLIEQDAKRLHVSL